MAPSGFARTIVALLRAPVCFRMSKVVRYLTRGRGSIVGTMCRRARIRVRRATLSGGGEYYGVLTHQFGRGARSALRSRCRFAAGAPGQRQYSRGDIQCHASASA